MTWQSTWRRHIRLGIILEMGVLYGFFFKNVVFWVKARNIEHYSRPVYVCMTSYTGTKLHDSLGMQCGN